MTIIQAMILGLVEGATEFVPISSTGHLLIARALMHLPLEGSLGFDAVLQFAAAIALVIYFWRDIVEIVYTFFDMIKGKVVDQTEKILIWSIIFGTIPAVIFGLLLQNYLDTVFRNIHLVAWATLAGAVLIYFAQKINEKSHAETKGQNKVLSIGKGIIIGFFQCLALVPGVSRSGATISGGLITGLKRSDAVRFSFLLSVPILLGSGALELFKARHELFAVGVGTVFLGALVSFAVAMTAIHYFIRFLKNHNMNIFVWYRVALFVAILIFL